MTVEISQGQPTVEGRYIAFVNGDRTDGWAEAKILTWQGGKWHYWRPVYGWIGPLPVLTTAELLRRAEPEYDL